MCVGITLWILSNYLFQATDILEQAFLYDKLANGGAVILSVGVLFFTQTFPQKSLNKYKLDNKSWIYLIIAAFFLYLSLFTSYIDYDVIYLDGGLKQVQASILKVPLYLFILFSLVSSFYFLIHTYRHSKGIFKFQVGIFGISLIISVIGGVLFNLILPTFGNFSFIIFGPTFTVCVAIASVYCMVNYRYTDFRIIFSEVFEKLVLGIFFILIITLINGITDEYFDNYIFTARTVLYGIFAVGFLVVVGFIKINSIKRALFVPDYQTKLELFTRKSVDFNSAEQFIKEYIHTLTSLVPVDSYKIFLKDKKEHKSYHDLIDLIYTNEEDNIIIYDEENKKLLDGNTENSVRLKIFDSLRKEIRANAIVRLKYLDNIVGYLLLDDKVNKQAFTKYDINFIKSLSETFAVYLYKLELYQDIQGFNDFLQKKIDDATQTLQAQKTQLEEKYQFEKDMMGIMGHELRTPMTVAKGMTELLLDKLKFGTAVNNEYLGQKLEKIFTSIIKESDLIQTMLSTSHIDNNKVNLQVAPVDIMELIDYAIVNFQKEAESKGLKLELIMPEFEVPKVKNDQSRLQEIITNLISNAIKYTNKGFVRVQLDKQGDSILYSVIDTGIGIPEEELKNIGKKFYRIHQHLDEKKDIVRAGGTGLGLYVVKGLLDAMGGGLLVESEEGLGSKFTAIIPLEVKDSDKVNISEAKTDENDMFAKLGLNGN